MLHHHPWNHQPAAERSDLGELLAFLVFVQVCDVCPLIRAHCFGADEVANSFLLTVDLAERAVRVLLPEDLITVDLNHQKMGGNALPCHADEKMKPNHKLWHSLLQRQMAYRV